MGYKCCITECPTGKVNKEKKEDEENDNNTSNINNNNEFAHVSVFQFPGKDEDIDRRLKWIHFVNRKDLKITSHTRICELHFEDQYIRKGKRNTLKHELRPIPTIREYSDDVPESVKHTPSPPPRKPPTKRYAPNEPREDELKRFRLDDRIESFEQLDATYAPSGFIFEKGDRCIVYYEKNIDELGIPFVNASIRVDEDLHVKLFLKGNPVPHPQWFRKNNHTDCKLTSRGQLTNFVTHIHSSSKKTLLDELQQINNMEPKGRPPFSADVMRFAHSPSVHLQTSIRSTA